MNTILRNNLIVGTTSIEGNALDDVVTVTIGETIKTKLSRDNRRGAHIAIHRSVVLIVYTTLFRDVERIAIDVLVQWPVENQTTLRTAKQAVVVGVYLISIEFLVPDTHLVDESSKGMSASAGTGIETVSIVRHRPGMMRSGCCRLHTVAVVVYRRKSGDGIFSLDDLISRTAEFRTTAAVRARSTDAGHTKIPYSERCVFLRHRIQRISAVLPHIVGIAGKAVIVDPVLVRQVTATRLWSVIQMMKIAQFIDLHLIRGRLCLQNELFGFFDISDTHRQLLLAVLLILRRLLLFAISTRANAVIGFEGF